MTNDRDATIDAPCKVPQGDVSRGAILRVLLRNRSVAKELQNRGRLSGPRHRTDTVLIDVLKSGDQLPYRRDFPEVLKDKVRG